MRILTVTESVTRACLYTMAGILNGSSYSLGYWPATMSSGLVRAALISLSIILTGDSMFSGCSKRSKVVLRQVKHLTGRCFFNA